MLGRKVIGWICPCYDGLRSVFGDRYLERLLACNENERLATVDAAYWRVQASGYRIIGVDGDVVETPPVRVLLKESAITHYTYTGACEREWY
jgi:hypothetical protein